MSVVHALLRHLTSSAQGTSHVILNNFSSLEKLLVITPHKILIREMSAKWYNFARNFLPQQARPKFKTSVLIVDCRSSQVRIQDLCKGGGAQPRFC